MLFNYLTVAFRNLTRNKFSTLVKLFSLSVGMICFAIISLFVYDEMSYDKFHRNPEQVFRVVKDFVNEEGSALPDATTPPALAPALSRELPEVAHATRVFPGWGRKFLLEVGDVRQYEENLMRIDSNFFDVFSFEFVKGSKTTALTSNNFILLTETSAKRYFQNEDPIGEPIRIGEGDAATDYFVTGVIKDVSRNSHFSFDFLTSIRSVGVPTLDSEWNWYNFYTYVRLHPDADAANFNSKLQPLYQMHNPEGTNQFYSQALTDIHLRSNLKWELGANGDYSYVIILITIAVFIMLLASINYINLVTAQSARRAKEVGVRKVSGAGQGLLVGQFLMESIVLTLAATILSISVAEAILPLFSELFNGTLSFLDGQNQVVLYTLLGIGVLTGILAGIYPALYISSFQPAAVLKGLSAKGSGGVFLRKGLVTFQFVISTVLIIGALVISSQIAYIQNKNIGFDKENVLLINNASRLPNRQVLLDEIKKNANVIEAGGANGVLGGQNWTTGISALESETELLLNFLMIDYNFLDAVKISFEEGRNFSPEFISDSTAVILNKTAVRQLNLLGPVIGSRVIAGDRRAENPLYLTVVGVLDDFHFTSFHDQIKPFGFILNESRVSTLFVKIGDQDVSGTIEEIEKVWNATVPDRPFEYSFQDAQIAKLYGAEQKFQKMFSYFTVVAIAIACLGLFGLSVYTAQLRLKEVGIRKILGASVLSITHLLSIEFLKLVGLAVLISMPLAWYLMSQWLQNFAYRMELSPVQFISAGLAAIIIAIATVSFHCVKAGMSNPVKALKDE